MKDIILIGGGGHCKAVIDVIEQEGRFKIIGIVDKPDLIGTNVLGYEVISDDLGLDRLVKRCKNTLITNGQIKSPLKRIHLYDKVVELGFTLSTVISPRAYISEHSSVGNGCVIKHDVVINAGAQI